jgi:membrane protein implicated in regulation of membrane protease activity
MEAHMSLWQVWVIVGIVLLIMELFTPGFFVACLGIAFLVTAIPAFFGGNVQLQIIVFSLANIVIFLALRPLLLKVLSPDKHATRTNADALIGRDGIVSEKIDPDTYSGRVKVGGEDWRAISNSGEAIGAGQKITVTKVDGAKLFVDLKK